VRERLAETKKKAAQIFGDSAADSQERCMRPEDYWAENCMPAAVNGIKRMLLMP
jgi:hypothetical protein